MKILAAILLCVVSAFGQSGACHGCGTHWEFGGFDGAATFSTEILISNHGGWSLETNVGANEGDRISLDVTCNKTVKGDCFVTAPYLSDFTPFARIFSKSGHQIYALNAPKTGDQIIHADYWWIGPSAHYHIRILASEPLK